MINKSSRIAVIGGGASGIIAAITAAENGGSVTLFEGGEKIGKKLLATGNGKCNLTNEVMSVKQYYSSNLDFVERALNQFGKEDTLNMLSGMGLATKSKNGYVYPLSEQASMVVEVFRCRLKELRVKLKENNKVTAVKKDKTGYEVWVDKYHEHFDKVILTCGGKAAPKTGSDGSGYHLAISFGHKMIPVVPALVQLKCKEKYFQGIQGVRSEGKVAIKNGNSILQEEVGEIQFNDYGISGIPVFQLSRTVNCMLISKPEVQIIIDLMPGFSKEGLYDLIIRRKEKFPDRTVEQIYNGLLNKKLMLLFMKLAELTPSMLASQVPDKQLLKVADLCKEWQVNVINSNGFEQAQVCAGGIDLQGITDHMESKELAGLFFAGEILDVDGRCGGYNLQWAFTSGYIAGLNAVALCDKNGVFQ